MYGHVARLAQGILKGADSVEGMAPVLNFVQNIYHLNSLVLGYDKLKSSRSIVAPLVNVNKFT